MSANQPIEEWTVDVRNQTYLVTLTGGDNGMVAIRVNGRMIAHPMTPAETERIFPVGDARYRVERGAEDTFTLRLDEPAVTPRVSNTTSSTSTLRARGIVWAFIALVVIGPLIWYVAATTYSRTARRRVEAVLRGMAAGPDSATVGLWARNARILGDVRELSWASDHFDAWRREKDLYRAIAAYHVLQVNKETAEVRTAVVDVVIDGRHLRIRVPENHPLAWAEDP